MGIRFLVVRYAQQGNPHLERRTKILGSGRSRHRRPVHGLKDEHGKEIYEGDVIRSPLSEDKTRPHRIFYHTGNAAFMGALVDRKELCYLRLDQDWIYKFGKEVIGNIHDNPELIEKQTAERHKTN